MTTGSGPLRRLHMFAEDSRARLRLEMLPLQLYGLAALGYVWLARPRTLQSHFLVLSLYLGYLVCFAVLSGVGWKQLRSGARRDAFVNLGFAILNTILGCIAWSLILEEDMKWL